ncbi:MAG: transglycosylase SLT domain-containing protein [Thermodesulfobacteriota bacterium]
MKGNKGWQLFISLEIGYAEHGTGALLTPPLSEERMKMILKILIVISLISFSTPCWADIYKYEDENGVIHFTNRPRDPQFKLYLQDRTGKGEEMPGASFETDPPSVDHPYEALISAVSNKYQVDSALIKAIIRAESGFNPLAVSPKGARGLMQLMPETASRVKVSNPFNPQENIEGGVRHFKYLLSLFHNDVRLSLAAYNAGEDIVSKLRTIPPYRETIDYVRKVLYFYQLNQGQKAIIF